MSATETFVDARHAGGAILVDVDQDDEIFVGCVRLEIPGSNPIPLYPHEARALAAALIEAAEQSQKKTPDAVSLETDAARVMHRISHHNNGETMSTTTLPSSPVRVLCDRCVDATYPRQDCPDCAAETQRELHRTTEPGAPEHDGIGGGL